ncbi:MAG: hypothetical protein ACMXYF_05355 [Candidatus Woesearchaeota archaeon]
MNVNPVYLQAKTIAQIQAQSKENALIPNIKLADFFQDDAVKKQFLQATFFEFTDLLHGQYAFAKVTLDCQNALGEFLEKVLSVKVTSLDCAVYKLKPGSYSLLVDDAKPQTGVDIIFDFTESFDSRARAELVYQTPKDLIDIPAHNGVTLVWKKDARWFFKYMNHYGKERIIGIASITNV